VSAIGPATARQLREKKIPVAYMPKEYIAEALLKGFEKRPVEGKRILLARAKKARDILPKGLKSMGAKVDVVEVYRTVKPMGKKKLRQLLADGNIDAITFTSSSTVNHFAELLKKGDLKKLLKGVVIGCIGPVTLRTAKGWGMKVQIQPKQYTVPGLTRAIVEYFASYSSPLCRRRSEGGNAPVSYRRHLLSISVMSFIPFNHYQIAEKLSRFAQRKEFQDPQKIFSYLFDFQEGIINDFDVGKVAPPIFFQSIKKTLDLSISFEEFTPIWNDIFTEDREVSRIILSLKGSVQLGLLSNTDSLHFHYILSKFPVMRAFDKWILSYEVGFKKPATEIFQKAMAWASVKPSKILFIDDMKTHVDVAISLGMQGIHFISADQFKDALYKKGVRPC
jgi:FMN phosphatase YigB (HAD superfamily)